MPHCACLRVTALRIKACLDAHLYAMYLTRLSALCMLAEMNMVRHADFNPMILSKACMHACIVTFLSMSRAKLGGTGTVNACAQT